MTHMYDGDGHVGGAAGGPPRTRAYGTYSIIAKR